MFDSMLSHVLFPPLALHALVSALYLLLAITLWLGRWRGPLRAQPAITRRVAVLALRILLLAALVLHGLVLVGDVLPFGLMRFGFAEALSTMLWLAIALYWVESFYARMEGLQMLALPLAALCALLPAWLPGPLLHVNVSAPLFRLHFLVAMLAYSLFTLAALHAILMALAERRLHSGRFTPLFMSLPPLLAMEALLFRLLHIAYVLLTLTLVSGVVFSEELFGKPLALTHKSVFALISWLIFSALLWGRHWRGWRGPQALRWTLAGFFALLLAYVGTRFVLEAILHRV